MKQNYDLDKIELYPYYVRQPSHPLLPEYTPSEVDPHIEALQSVGIYETLTPEYQATIIKLMQSAYRNGRASVGAEKIDSDVVWVDGIGALERQVDGSWILTMPDRGIEKIAAAQLGHMGGIQKSEAKTITSRKNGRLGGRPKKSDN